MSDHTTSGTLLQELVPFALAQSVKEVTRADTHTARTG
jgi:hypothetical protein